MIDGIVFLGGFILGIVFETAALLIVAYFAYSSGPSDPPQVPPDLREEPEEDPLFRCAYHGRNFYDREEAKEHAVDVHNAPRNGTAWEHTYTGSDE